MAYNSVATPVFYISWGDWYKSLGYDVKRNHTISPVETYTSTIYTGNGYAIATEFYSTIPGNGANGVNFLAVLNHNLNADWRFINKRVAADGSQDQEAEGYMTNIVNMPVMYNGFSFFKHPTLSEDYSSSTTETIASGFRTVSGENTSADFDGIFGCYVWGRYFTMPHSPDMNLSIEYETGTKNIETRGGASLSNTMWRPPMWGSLAPWELSDPASPTSNQTLAHSSRRTWNLSFSFLSKENTFPEYNALNKLADNFDETADTDQTLLTSDDFFSQVWNRVGTANRFIFQPDESVPEFAICKFTKNLSVKQVAHQIYTIKLSLREVW